MGGTPLGQSDVGTAGSKYLLAIVEEQAAAGAAEATARALVRLCTATGCRSHVCATRLPNSGIAALWGPTRATMNGGYMLTAVGQHACRVKNVRRDLGG